MRLDMDLVRKIMLALEERGVILGDVVLEIDGYDEKTLTYHLVLMAEGGLIDGIAVHTFDGPGFMPRRLTWEGHQFLEASRDDGRWEKAKDVAGQMGGVTMKVLQEILVALLQAQLRAMGLG